MLGRRSSQGVTMKYFLLVVALIVAVVLAAMYVPVKDGRTLLDAEQVRSVVTGAVQDDDAAMDAQDDALAPGTMYRWKDRHGNWQYGDRPPPGVPAEPVTLKETQRLESLPPGALKE